MNNPSPERETVHGRKIERLRWHEGRLQQCFSEKYERYESGRLLTAGAREIWEDVPGDPPVIQDPHGSKHRGCADSRSATM